MIDHNKHLQIGVIVLNYGDHLTTKSCIDSILAQQVHPKAIVLINNAAAKNSEAYFESCFKNESSLKIFHFDENLGYTGGNNAGISYLLKQPIDVICLLNNDTLLLPGFFEYLSACFSGKSQPDIVTPLIFFKDGKTIWSAGEKTFYPLLISWSSRGRFEDPCKSLINQINCVTGCAMAVRRQVFQRIGLLDEAYFAYVEDTDFCRRALDAGFRIALCSQARMIHEVSRTAGHLSPMQFYFKSRNRAYFIKKNVPWPLWPAAYTWYFLVNLTWIIKQSAAGRGDSIHAIFAGVIDWIGGRMGAGRSAQWQKEKIDSGTQQ